MWPFSRTIWSPRSSSSASAIAASSATSTRAASRRSCRACSRPSSTSASSATASSTSPTSSARPISSTTRTRTRRKGGGDDKSGVRRPHDRASPDSAAGRRAIGPASSGEARPNGQRRRRTSRRSERATSQEARIEDLLKEGQEILVQVAKEPLGTKGARLTSHVTLPGRFLVFMPTVDHIGVSRKIASREERGAAARHRPRVPRAARLQRRRHHPHRGGGAVEGRHPRRPAVLLPHLDRHAAEDGVAPRAGGRLPRAEPGRQAAARSADRRLHRHPHRPSAGAPARGRVHRPHHAGAVQRA